MAFSPQPKPIPRVVTRLATRRTATTLDRAAKEAVRQRDHESCRVCGRWSRFVHERVFKSRGGTASVDNSFVVCHICHLYLHGHAITTFESTANGALLFEMDATVARHVFRGRAAVPGVVTILRERP